MYQSKAPRGSPGDSSDSSDSGDSDFGADFLAIEPESDHASDSEDTKRRKRAARRKYRATMARLKYQQGFLKHEPPFTYNGEATAMIFKKWVHEVRDWMTRARLSMRQGIRMLGKYLAGPAYKFYERDVLDLQKKYSIRKKGLCHNNLWQLIYVTIYVKIVCRYIQ